MNKMAVIGSIITEYGIPWTINRFLYSCKLKMLQLAPGTEVLFEPRKLISPSRLDIFNLNTDAIAKFLKELSLEEQNRLINKADQACLGKIFGFSSVMLDYGYPIDWQLNPLTGKSCDKSTKWYRIPDFDPERGDIKVVWEASRFTHFYLFARAYLLTSDINYYTSFKVQLADWLDNNPYSYGANYKCGQECALRLINCLMTYSVFLQVGLADVSDEQNVKELVSRSYRKILSNFFYAYRCIKNNHTISELVGMIIGAWCCDNQKQVTKAYHMLNKVICDQFTEDGGYKQFSFNYQRLALQNIECVLSITAKIKHTLSNKSIERVNKSCLLMYQCLSPDGNLPNYGPNDGALIFPVTNSDYRDYRSVINAISVLTSGYRLLPAGIYDEELLWFAQGIKEYPIESRQQVSSSFPNAGLFTFRQDNSFLMVVLNEFHSRPAHMDQMHVDFWIDGINVLCDGGTYSYASELGKELASTSGHNSAKVDAIEQMNKSGAFLLYNWTHRKAFTYNSNSFSGEMISRNGYSHNRIVSATSYGYEIKDEIKLKGKGKAIDLLFHTPCKVEKEGSVVTFYNASKPVFSLAFDSCDITIEQKERSLYYFKNELVNQVRVHLEANCTQGKNKTEIKVFQIGE